MANLSKTFVAGDDFLTETMLTGLARSEDLNKYWIVAQSEQRCEELRRKYNIKATTDLNFVSDVPVVILMFKFENAKDTLSNLADKISKDTVIISIVPGIALIFIQNFFPNNQIVRFTLNPSIISGEGLAAYVAGKNATDETKSLARDMLSSFGKIVEVGNEDEFEKVRRFIFTNTFLSYVIVRSMIDAGVKQGFSTEQAGDIVDQILKGASHTLIKFQFEGGEMLKDGLRNTEFTNRAIGLVKEYGIYDSIERYLTIKGAKSIFEAHSDDNDETGLNLNYNWFNKFTGD